MIGTKYLSVGAGVTAVGAAALLMVQYGSLAATPERTPVPEVRTAAQPFDFAFSQAYPWGVGPGSPVGSSGVAALSAISDYSNGIAVGAKGTLDSINQVGPTAFGLNSIRSISANQAPNGAQPATANVTSLDQWVLGVAGLASSVGVVGFTEDGAAYDPFIGTHAGVLQTANTFGPMFFNLNVLKAIGLTQAPSGTLLPSGQPDDFSAVDIGRWSGGIPGLITNTGTTGFVVSRDFGAGPINDYYIGGLHTTTQIGSMTFDFNVLPSISTSIFPPGISFTMSPDMTAANTPFAGITPPPPGIVQPLVTDPPAVQPVDDPAPKAAAVEPVSAATAPPAEDTPKVATSKIDDTKPEVVIPGVNGAPSARRRVLGRPAAAEASPSIRGSR